MHPTQLFFEDWSHLTTFIYCRSTYETLDYVSTTMFPRIDWLCDTFDKRNWCSWNNNSWFQLIRIKKKNIFYTTDEQKRELHREIEMKQRRWTQVRHFSGWFIILSRNDFILQLQTHFMISTVNYISWFQSSILKHFIIIFHSLDVLNTLIDSDLLIP